MIIKTDILKDENNKRYYGSSIYPLISPKQSDIYIITTEGDRLDIFANRYYGDSSLWRIIAASNDIRQDSVFIIPGTQLRIPTDISAFLNELSNVNER